MTDTVAIPSWVAAVMDRLLHENEELRRRLLETSDVATFLAAIDAEELEKAALARIEGFDGRSATQLMLDVLIDWVSPQ